MEATIHMYRRLPCIGLSISRQPLSIAVLKNVAKSILLTFNAFFVKMKVFTCMEVITWMKQVKKL